jgi:hypothetical protein
MHRILTFVAAAAILFASAPGPAFADAGPPYKLDAKGKCHDAKGRYAKTEMCKGAGATMAPAGAAATGAATTTTTTAKGGKCRDPQTKKYVKCGTPGAEPVPASTKSTTTKSATTTSATTTPAATTTKKKKSAKPAATTTTTTSSAAAPH